MRPIIDPRSNLPSLLAKLYEDPERIRLTLRNAGAQTEELSFEGSPLIIWHRIAEELWRQQRLEDLIEVAVGQYPRRELQLRLALAYYQRTSDATADADGKLTRPGFFRYLLDRYLPHIHAFLTRSGALSMPPELSVLREYLRSLRSELRHELRDRTYLPLAARNVSLPSLPQPDSDPFISPLNQIILHLSGREHGGDSASAQIAAVNRGSRTVRNILDAVGRSESPLVLLGEPGSGKTMTLQNAAMIMAGREESRIFPRVPMYVRLGEFYCEHKPTHSDVMAYLKETAPVGVADYLEPLDRADRLVVFFDGMDEMSRARYTEHTEALSRFAEGRRTLFSCRITDFSPAFLHERLVVLPFDRGRIREYLGRYIGYFPIEIDGQQWSRKKLTERIARGHLPVEADNPFVLWLLCLYVQSRHSWPSSRVELLRFYIEQAFERKLEEMEEAHEDPLPPLEICLTEWSRLAYEISVRNRGSALPVAEIAEGDPERLHDVIRAGKLCGVIGESREKHVYMIRFQHHRFQEYFTALHIFGQQTSAEPGPELDWLALFDAPRWQETITNLVLMGKADRVIRTLAHSIRKEALVFRLSSLKSGPAASNEVMVADRVDFASRILRQRVQPSEAWSDLSDATKNAIERLVTHGNPITQVKMIRVCLNLPDLELVDILRIPLNSDITWVRNQALVLLASSQGAARTLGSDLPTEIGYDLGSLRFAGRWIAYLRAAAGARSLRQWWPVAAGSIAFALHFAMLFLLAAALYAGIWSVSYYDPARHKVDPLFDRFSYKRAEDWNRPLMPGAIKPFWPIPPPEKQAENWARVSRSLQSLREPGSMATAAAAIVLAGGIALLRSPGILWLAMLGAAAGSALLICGLRDLWTGSVMGFLLTFMGWGILLYIAGLAGVIAFAIHAGIVMMYLFATARQRQTQIPVAALLRTAWTANHYGTVLPARGLKTGGIFLLAWVLLFTAGASAAQVITDTTRLPYHPVINASLVLLAVAAAYLAGLGVLGQTSRARGLLSNTGAFVFVMGLILLVLWGIDLAFRWIGSQSVWLNVARTIVLIAAVGVLYLGVRTARLFWRELARFRLRPYPPNSLERESWIANLTKAEPGDQEVILLKTTHKALGLSPDGYLALLGEIEPLIEHEPARSTYWDQRDRLQEILRQERT